LLTASLLNAPAALTIAALMIPPDGDPRETPSLGRTDIHSSMEAVATGTIDGVWLVINVAAMLIVMVALVALANQILGALPNVAGAPLTLQRALGWIASPFAWSLGIPWHEAPAAGALIGVKVVVNAPPPKGGGFGLRLKAGSVRHSADSSTYTWSRLIATAWITISCAQAVSRKSSRHRCPASPPSAGQRYFVTQTT